MIGDKSVLGLVPARGNSRGLPGKNIRELCGKPLITWTIEKALKSACIDRLIASTDSRAIADIAAAAGASVPFLRPTDLAADDTPTVAVVEHALEFLREQGDTFDYVVLLEPTSPLREDDDIDAMLRRLHGLTASFDSIVSVGEVGEHPSVVKRLAGDSLEPFCSDLATTSRRQDNEPAFFPYAVAYIAKTKALLAERTFHTRRCTHYRIKPYQALEIDNIYDFLAVESVMRYEWKVS